MSTNVGDIWVYLAATPLLGLTATIAAYQGAMWLHQRLHHAALSNPIFIAVLLVAGFLAASDISYEAYFRGAQFVHFLLGPATVALAVPLYRNCRHLKQLAIPILLTVICGSLMAALSGVGIAWAFGVPGDVLRSIAPKSVTAAIAMGISERIGGTPALTTAAAIATGIIGAVLARPVLNLVGAKDWRARGFAVGLSAHGIGTARAFSVNELAGAFSTLAMGLNGLASAVLLPLLFAWLRI